MGYRFRNYLSSTWRRAGLLPTGLEIYFSFFFAWPTLGISHVGFLSYKRLTRSTNNKIPFFPFIFKKDFFGFILILCLYLLQTHFGISSFSHPDNALEVCGLLTPLHIVPEWYFLCQYAMLKAVKFNNILTKSHTITGLLLYYYLISNSLLLGSHSRKKNPEIVEFSKDTILISING